MARTKVRRSTALTVRRPAELLPEATRESCLELGLSQAQVENICYLAGVYGTTTPHLVRWIKEGVKPEALGYCMEVRQYVMGRTDTKVSPVTVYRCIEELGFHLPSEIEVPEGKHLLDGHAVSLRELQVAEFKRIVTGELPNYRPVLQDDGLVEIIETFVEATHALNLHNIDPLDFVMRKMRQYGMDIHQAYHQACDDPDFFSEQVLRGRTDEYGSAFRQLPGYHCDDEGHWEGDE